MRIVVKKFGGTSVGDLDRIRNVAARIADFKAKNPDVQVVAVVSAMAGETNSLIELAKGAVDTPTPREMDVLLATGEQKTCSLLSMILSEKGLSAKSLVATQAKIFTDTRHSNAKIENIDTSKIKKILEEDQIPVVAGFQGINDQGDLTTLGRGGSDISAVAIAAALKAEACYIYTDVEGVYSTNPSICKEAKKISKIAHVEMLELASLGAKVLHPRSVYFAMQYKIPLVVLSSFSEAEGTWIVKEEELMEKPVVSGISYRTDEAKITIHKLKSTSNAMDKIFGTLAKQDIFVDMITQTGIVDDKTNISFTCADDHSSTALGLLNDLVPELDAEGVSLDRDIAKVSIVGVGMKYHAGVASHMFNVLAEEGIGVEMISTSEIKLSVIIPRKYCEVAVRSLHQRFIEHSPEVLEEEQDNLLDLAS